MFWRPWFQSFLCAVSMWSSYRRLHPDISMIDEGDIPPVQYKTSNRWPKSMRSVNGMSLTFIDFYVPAFTTGTHRKRRSFSYANRFHGNVFVSPSNRLFIKNLLLSNGVVILFFSAGTCLASRCPAIDVSSGSTISAFRRHVTVCKRWTRFNWLRILDWMEDPWAHDDVSSGYLLMSKY
jgi:hypothetical protein